MKDKWIHSYLVTHAGNESTNYIKRGIPLRLFPTPHGFLQLRRSFGGRQCFFYCRPKPEVSFILSNKLAAVKDKAVNTVPVG